MGGARGKFLNNRHRDNTHVYIYYRCLYVFILVLTLIIVLDFILTIWIMVVLNFGFNGMGAIKIGTDEIRIIGKTKFEKAVQFSQISTENVYF